MVRVIFCLAAAFLTSSCIDLYGAFLAPTPKLSLASVAVVPQPPAQEWEIPCFDAACVGTKPIPYLKVSFFSDIDLREMTASRHLNTFARAYWCNSKSDPPPHEFSLDQLVFDNFVREQNDAAIEFHADTEPSQPAEYHIYIPAAWPWSPPLTYDLHEKPRSICFRVEGGTGLENGNLIPYQIATNAIFVSEDQLQQAFAEHGAITGDKTR